MDADQNNEEPVVDQGEDQDEIKEDFDEMPNEDDDLVGVNKQYLDVHNGVQGLSENIGLDGYSIEDLKRNVYINQQIVFNIDFLDELIKNAPKLKMGGPKRETKRREIKKPDNNNRNNPKTKGLNVPKKNISSIQFSQPKPNPYSDITLYLLLSIEVIASRIIDQILGLLKDPKYSSKGDKIESKYIHLVIRFDQELEALFTRDPILYDVLSRVDQATLKLITEYKLREYPSVKFTTQHQYYNINPIKQCDINKLLHKFDYSLSFHTDAINLFTLLLNRLFQHLFMTLINNDLINDFANVREAINTIYGDQLFSDVSRRYEDILTTINKDFVKGDTIKLSIVSLLSRTKITQTYTCEILGDLKMTVLKFLYYIRYNRPLAKEPQQLSELLAELAKFDNLDNTFVYNSNNISYNDKLTDLGLFRDAKIFYMSKKYYEDLQKIDARKGLATEPKKIFKISDFNPKPTSSKQPAMPKKPGYDKELDKNKNPQFAEKVLNGMNLIEGVIDSFSDLYSELSFIHNYYHKGFTNAPKLSQQSLEQIKNTLFTNTDDLKNSLTSLIDDDYKNVENGVGLQDENNINDGTDGNDGPNKTTDTNDAV